MRRGTFLSRFGLRRLRWVSWARVTPEQYGGMETDSWPQLDYKRRAIARGVSAVCRRRSWFTGIGATHLSLIGAPEAMKAEIAPPVLRGESWISLGITEPGGGSDVASLKTTAVRDGDHYIVNGSKTYITGGMRAKLCLYGCSNRRVTAQPVFRCCLSPTDAEGFSRTALDKKMGWWASDTATLYFDNVRVPVFQPDWAREPGLQGHHDELQQ